MDRQEGGRVVVYQPDPAGGDADGVEGGDGGGVGGLDQLPEARRMTRCFGARNRISWRYNQR